MNSITIVIKDKEYILKQSFRSYLLFEELTNKQIGEIEGMKDILTLLYCTFKGCNKSWEYSFDEFIDIIDDDPEILTKFNEFNNSVTSTDEKKNQVKV